MGEPTNPSPTPSSARLLDIAHVLRKRLSHWHEYDELEMQGYDYITAMDLAGNRFRKLVDPRPEPPQEAMRFFAFDQGPMVPVDEPYPETWESMPVPKEYEGYAGIATRVPSRLTDRSDTWQWMGYFLWNLKQFPDHPAVEYVQTVFEAVLDLTMYFQRELPPRLIFHPDRPYYLAGRQQPTDLLDRLVSATEKLHDLVIAGTISLRCDPSPVVTLTEDTAPPPADTGVTLMDAAMYFESSDERAARALVRKWHDQDVVPTESLGRCPTDGRARLYRLRDVLEKVAGANGLSKKEQSRLEQHLRSRQRTPRS